MPQSLTLVPDIALLRPGLSRPLDLRPFFKRTDIVAFSHDLGPVPGSSDALSPLAPYLAWCRRADGALVHCRPEDLPDRAARGIAALAGSLRQIAPFHMTGNEMDPDFNTLFRVHYYPSCTIVAWAEMGMAGDYLDQEDLLSPSHMLGSIFVEPPESAHDRVALMAGLKRDWANHVAHVNHAVAGYDIRPGDLPAIDFSATLR